MISRIKEPYSWVGHIPFAFMLVDITKPDLIVELGTYSGNSFCSFCQAVKQFSVKSKVFGIDLWSGDFHSGFYDNSVYNELSDYVDSNYSNFASLLRKDFNDAVSDFKDKSIDILHIDGLHTYEAVRNDFQSWKSKVKDDGIILFHDTQVLGYGFGVYLFWEEVKKEYPLNFEFKHSNGLGIISLGNSKRNLDLYETLNKESTKFLLEKFGKGMLENLYLERRLNYFESSLIGKIYHLVKKINKKLKQIFTNGRK